MISHRRGDDFMNEKEKRILREYFKDGPQVLLFYTVLCLVCMIFFFVEDNLINVLLMFLVWLGLMVWWGGLIFRKLFQLLSLVKKELGQGQNRTNTITIQSVEHDKEYSLPRNRGRGGFFDNRLVVYDESGEYYRFVTKLGYFSNDDLTGKRIVIRYLPESRFILSVGILKIKEKCPDPHQRLRWVRALFHLYT